MFSRPNWSASYVTNAISSWRAESVKAEFLQHAKDEQQHCDWIAERIVQLNGEPNSDPEGLAARSHSEYQEGSNLIEMIKEDLIAERIAVESYTEIARWLGDDDSTTRRLIEAILQDGKRTRR
jgi:bacterioferritin